MNRQPDKRNVFGLGLVSLLNDTASEMIYPLLPAFLTTVLGAGPAVLGIIEGVAETTASVLKLFSGILSDRTGRRKPIFAAGYFFSNLVRPFLALATGWWQVLVIRFGDRIGKGIRTSPRDALLSDSAPESQRGWAFGVQRAMDHAGAALGPLVATILLTFGHLSVRSVFFLSAIPGVLVILTVLFLIRETRPESPAAREEKDPSLNIRGTPSGYRWFLAAVLIFTLGNSTDAFLLLRAQHLGIPVALVPILWLVFHLSKTMFSVPGGSLSDRIGRRKGILIGWLVYALVYVGFALAVRPWQAWALFILYGLFYGLTGGAEKALVADFVPSHLRGKAFGVYHLTVGLAALPASILFGAVWNFAGAPTAFLMGASFAAAAVVPLSLARGS